MKFIALATTVAAAAVPASSASADSFKNIAVCNYAKCQQESYSTNVSVVKNSWGTAVQQSNTTTQQIGVGNDSDSRTVQVIK
jgi:Skp family chaperone for outer membrane proteins